MAFLKCALVDDDLDFINVLKASILHYFPKIQIDGYCLTGSDFYQQNYDVYFLDIDMQENGLLVAQRLRELKGERIYLIFITSYGNLSSEGYRFKAFWFIEKSRWQQVLPEVLLALQTELMHHMIAIRNEDKQLIFLELEDILYITAIANQIIIQTNVRKYITYSSVKQFMEKLPATTFIKVQSGAVINKTKVHSFDRKNGELILCQGDKFIVSRRLRTALYRVLSSI